MERIFNHIITTLIGLVIIAAAVYMVATEKTSMTEAAGWLTLGLTLVRAKDTLIGVKGD